MVWSKKLPNILSFSSAELCGRGSLVLAGIAALGVRGAVKGMNMGYSYPSSLFLCQSYSQDGAGIPVAQWEWVRGHLGDAGVDVVRCPSKENWLHPEETPQVREETELSVPGLPPGGSSNGHLLFFLSLQGCCGPAFPGLQGPA